MVGNKINFTGAPESADTSTRQEGGTHPNSFGTEAPTLGTLQTALYAPLHLAAQLCPV